MNSHTKWQTFRIKVLRLPQKQMQLIFWKPCKKVLCLSHKMTFRYFFRHVRTPRSAMPATRNDVAQRLKHPKVAAFAAVPIGTAMATSSRTVANGCGCESGLVQTRPNSQTPKVNQNPSLCIRQKAADPFQIWQFEAQSRSMMQLKIDFSSNMVTSRDAQWSWSYVLSVPQGLLRWWQRLSDGQWVK